MQMTPNVTN